MECPVCRTALPTAARFCAGCGAAVTVRGDGRPADPLRAALESAIGFQYRFERLLGRGGMGAVYFAHELALDRGVAVKVLPPEQAGSPEARERFRREARTAARLSHPNIVPLHTFGEVGGLVYFVMGYVRGESLALRLKRLGRLDAEETRRLLSEIADALDYAHRQGVVHRDIKPDNVLLDEDSGRPLLTDFGIAKAQQAGPWLTAAGYILGTPHYMSPEQASGQPDVDARSDLYSLGVMGYSMLSGRLPFEGKTPAEVLVQHLTREPVPLRSVADGAPEELVAAIVRCMAKDPTKRWADARSLRDALALTGRREDEELPEVKTLRIGLVGTALALVAVSCVGLSRSTNPGWQPTAALWDTLFAIGGVSLVAVLGGAALLLQDQGMGWREVLHKALEQPRWWRFGYPRRFRRPGDVWDRLPAPIRRFRRLCVLWLLYTALVVLPFLIALTAGDEYYARTGQRTAVGAFALVLSKRGNLVVLPHLAFMTLLFVELFRARRWLAAGPGLDLRDAEKALLAPTWKASFWGRKPFDSILGPERDAGTANADRVERMIARLAEQLATDLGTLGADAVTAAQALRSSIRSLEREIANLEKDAGSAEQARLQDRLVSLGPSSAEEPAERRQMRDLLTGQLALVRSLTVRREEARWDYSRATGLLRNLYLELVGLRDESTRGGETWSSHTARLRALCDEITRWVGSATHTATHTASNPGGEDRPTWGR
jgi:serine/threonine protein kinase